VYGEKQDEHIVLHLTFVFGSELKAVIAHPAVPREVDPAALDQFLTLEYIPAPRTIFKGVCKLPPGHLLTYQDGKLNLEPYWDVPFREMDADEAGYAEILRELIDDAVRLRLVSDLRAAGSYADARKQGTVRLEGRTYRIQDGDIVQIRFNV